MVAHPDRRNLHSAALPELTWSQAHATESLNVLFRTAESRVIDTIEWYLRRKRAKARWSKSLRTAAILLGLAGGLTPLAHSVNRDFIDLAWGYVLLGGSAGSVLYDRFFGYSASWMRYMRTVSRLQRVLANAQQAWARAWAEVGDGPATAQQRAAMLSMIADFVDTVAQQIEAETAEWISDLSEQLERMRQVTSTVNDAPRFNG